LGYTVANRRFARLRVPRPRHEGGLRMNLRISKGGRGAEPGVAHALQVTPDNFVRAETDMQFMTVVKRGGFGRLTHEREFPPAGRQATAWADGDVLRSRGVFDLELGPVVVTIPPFEQRFVSIEALDEDHYTVAMFHGAGTYTFSFDNVSTRYLLLVVRISVNPSDRADLGRVHALQEGIVISRQGGGRFVIPNWDPVSQARVRVALQLLGNTVASDERTFGARGEVDPVRHLIGTATQWDRCPPRDIACLHAVPRANDGRIVHRLSIGHVPVDGFWSLSVYDANGHFFTEDHGSRTINSFNAVRGADQAVVVQFGGGSPAVANCLSITRGWSYLVRLYRPRAEILGGKWRFPEAQPVFGSVGSGSR
jgi:hypothetical protein